MRALRGIDLWLTCAILFASGSLAPAGEVKLADMFRQLTDLDRLAFLEEGVTCRQFSSYDRASRIDTNGNLVAWDANTDLGQYLRVETNGEAVMAEMDGPGCIVQLWSANPRGLIRFYLDGATVPLEFNFTALTSGLVPPFSPPISSMGGAGYNSYLPIPYARHCKVTADVAHDQYYHIDYVTYPPGTRVETFHLPLTAKETNALRTASEVWNRAGEDPKPLRRKSRTLQDEVTLPPGQTVTLADLKGPAIITAFKARLQASERHALRKVLLRGFWDKSTQPGIEAPIGDFFGTGFYTNEYRSLPSGMTNGTGYCYWPMPFRRSGRIEVVNEGKQPARLAWQIVYASTRLPANAAYFHAQWRRTAPNTVFDWPFLECEGRGRFVGVAMNVQDPVPGWFGEGDEKIWVDDDQFPSWFGTGTEDYFCDAWGFRPFARPMHGCTLWNNPGRTSVYRWHVMDSIPFQKKFRMTIENYGKDKDYSCTAYWYQTEPSSNFFVRPSLADRLPWLNILPGIEAEALAVTGSVKTSVLSDETMPFELSGGKALSLAPQGTASCAVLTVPVQEEDVYQVVLHGATNMPAPAFEARIGNRSLGRVDEPFKGGEPVKLERARLYPPATQLTLNLIGDATTPLVLDTVQLIASPKQGHVLEGETLRVVSTSGPAAIQEDERLDCSGWSQLLFAAGREGDWVDLLLPPAGSSKVLLRARATQGPDYGTVQAFLGDRPLGDPIEGYADTPRTRPQFSLGIVELPEAQTNILRFKITGRAAASSGYRFGLDYVRLAVLVAENAIEAEDLEVNAQYIVAPLALDIAYGIGRWSGGGHLWCSGTRGQWVVLKLPYTPPGRYALDLYFTKAPDYGVVAVSIDGQQLGEPFDCYGTAVLEPSGKVSFGNVQLADKSHYIGFVVNTKNAKSRNYWMGIDCLTLTPVSEPGPGAAAP